MFIYALLPLLALPYALGGLVARDTTCPSDPEGKDRRSYSFTNNICDRATITLDGNNMTDQGCINEKDAQSIIPGFEVDEDGSYCLVKYSKKECQCPAKVVSYDFKKGEQPDCIRMDDGEFFSYSWVKSCPEHSGCPVADPQCPID